MWLPSCRPASSQVKLVVVDSITFHFRQELQDMAQRTRTLGQLAQDLLSQADSRHVAVGGRSDDSDTSCTVNSEQLRCYPQKHVS